jgi:beta-glucanase (GH16 family)
VKRTAILLLIACVLTLSGCLSHQAAYRAEPKRALLPVSGPTVQEAPPPVWGDEFNGTQVNTSKWWVYDGPGNDGNGIRAPTHVGEGDGMLTLTCTADQQCAGLMANHAQKYGTWVARVKMSAGDNNVHPILLLWPSDDVWPAHGEVDYMEASYPERQATDGFLHFGSNNDQTHGKVDVDLTQWHVFSVTWTPSSITYYVDGQQWFQDTDPSHLPPITMSPTIQLDAQGPISQGGTMEVDWLRVYDH